MSRMELILKKPVEELIPQLIAWNNAELMADVKNSLAKYQGKVYDDKSIAEAKGDRAKLNKFSKALNDERIKIRKIYEEPYNKFKSEVDEVIKLVDTTSNAINLQISEYELERQTAKQAGIKSYFESVVGDLADFISYEKLHSQQWLNASVSLTKVYAEIDAKLEQINNEITTIKALSSDDETSLLAYYFRSLNLAAALMENERIKAERQRIADSKAKAIASEQQPLVVHVEPVKPEVTSEPTPVAEKAYTLRFEVSGTQSKLIALKEFLISNQIDYKQI